MRGEVWWTKVHGRRQSTHTKDRHEAEVVLAARILDGRALTDERVGDAVAVLRAFLAQNNLRELLRKRRKDAESKLKRRFGGEVPHHIRQIDKMVRRFEAFQRAKKLGYRFHIGNPYCIYGLAREQPNGE